MFFLKLNFKSVEFISVFFFLKQNTSEWFSVMYVYYTNQIGATINSQ